MNDKALKAAVSQFLKNVSSTAQREMENAIRNAVTDGKLRGNETLSVGVTLTNEKSGLNMTIYTKLELH
jgi:hypothetical protein